MAEKTYCGMTMKMLKEFQASFDIIDVTSYKRVINDLIAEIEEQRLEIAGWWPDSKEAELGQMQANNKKLKAVAEAALEEHRWTNMHHDDEDCYEVWFRAAQDTDDALKAAGYLKDE